MTRIKGMPAAKAGILVRLIYRLSRRSVGRDVDPIAVYAHAKGLLIGYGVLEQATARQRRVDERLKMLAVLKAAALVNCEFCADIGSAKARDANITEEQLLALPRYRDSDAFSAKERLVLDYAVAITRTPSAVTDELFDAMHDQFAEPELVELTHIIALENLRSRFNSAFDMTPAGFSEGMVCIAPERDAQADAAPDAPAPPTPREPSPLPAA